MRVILEAGFTFWGVFVGFALLVGAYVWWMRWVEGGEDDR